MTTSTISPILKDPVSVIRDPNWKNSMLDEYNALIDNHTWDFVPRPPNVNVILSMWIFCHKQNSDATIRTVLSIVISHSWSIHQLDVKNAFLHGYLNETVYMHQPMGQGSNTAYILLYVDDIILTTSSNPLQTHFMGLMSSEFAMKDLGPLSFFLGIAVSRNDDGMFLSQKQYASSIIDRASMSNCSPCPTPVDTKSKLSATHDAPYDDPTKYRSLAGALQYLTFTRPDISYDV
ncbi:uncharacterized protein LOC110710811 [Chenopodium quinoa]|uniref:uncharacterized protein LOC110710811 n=1 Tax=Chenopodium quinoa TaxID=63459 RepID=UPI000B785E12|nr:uncharacterized protein LOC110710811 [Chenopodium quinoa]